MPAVTPKPEEKEKTDEIELSKTEAKIIEQELNDIKQDQSM